MPNTASIFELALRAQGEKPASSSGNGKVSSQINIVRLDALQGEEALSCRLAHSAEWRQGDKAATTIAADPVADSFRNWVAAECARLCHFAFALKDAK